MIMTCTCMYTHANVRKYVAYVHIMFSGVILYILSV